METSTAKQSPAFLYLAAFLVPIFLRAIAVPLQLDIVFALFVPMAALVFVPASSLVLAVAAVTRKVSIRTSHIAASALLFWVWLTFLIMQMHVNY